MVFPREEPTNFYAISKDSMHIKVILYGLSRPYLEINRARREMSMEKSVMRKWKGQVQSYYNLKNFINGK